MSNLTGKYAVVTGGTRGIGYAIATRLKKENATVLITGTQAVAKNLENFDYFSADFNDAENIAQFARFLSDKKPDILINNAGTNLIDNFCDIPLNDFNNIQQINVLAPFQLCQAVIPSMKFKKWGRIINITSVLSRVSKSGRASYSASKFALDGLTSALAAEVAQYGILANCVAPGFIETDLTKRILGESGMQEIAQQVPMRRLGKPEEIAALVAWLVSPENTYISGQNIVIDGGFTRV